MTEPTPTLADIYAKCEEIRAQQDRLDEQFADWGALIAPTGYNPRAWETYRRDAGCGCTAPDPADCAEDHSPLAGVRPEAQWAFVCVCHRLATIAPADAPHGPQDAATTAGADTETPDSGTGPQTGAQAIEWPDYTAISTYRHTATGRHAWAARCWGNGPCAGWVGLDHDTERWAQVALARHLRDDHNVVVKLPEQMPSAPPSGLRERIADAIHRDAQAPTGRRVGIVHAVARAVEADHNRLAAEVARLTRLLGEYADRGIANGQRAERAEATVRRVRKMANAWRTQLPDAIDRDTVVEQLLHATEALAHLDQP